MLKFMKKSIAIFLAILTIFTMFSFSGFAASKTKITASNVTYKAEYAYTGKAIKPAVKVVVKKTTLKNTKDYTVKYDNNTKIGTGNITITGKGNYTGTVKLKFNIVMGVPTSLKASSINHKTAKLSWSKVTGASKYYVYKYDTASKKYVNTYTVTTNSATVSVIPTKNTKYAVKAIGSKASALSSAINIMGKIAAPALKAKALGTDSVEFTWNKIDKATGYRIYLMNASGDGYTIVKTINSPSTLTYTVKGLTAGTGYQYYATAFYLDKNGNKVFSNKSAVVTAVTAPVDVTGINATGTGSSVIKLSWKKVSGATGYEVYQYDSAAKKYNSIGKTTATSYSVKNLKTETKYNFIVKSYKTVNGVTTKSTGVKVSATTLDANELRDFQNVIKSGEFYVNFQIPSEDMTVDSKIYVLNKVAVNDSSTSYNGIEMIMKTYYSEADKKGYIIADIDDVFMKALAAAAGMKLPAYQQISAAQAKEDGLDAAGYIKMFAPEPYPGRVPTESTGKVNGAGKEYKTYSYVTADRSFIVYYFDKTSGKLCYITTGGQTIKITGYSDTVKSSSVALPEKFPKGYTKRDDLI